MRKRCCAAAILSMLLAAGCNHYGAIENNFGKSYEMAKQGQILNPDASKNLKPVTGLGGKASEAAAKKYADSFSGGNSHQTTQPGFAVVPVAPFGTGETDHDVNAK